MLPGYHSLLIIGLFRGNESRVGHVEKNSKMCVFQVSSSYCFFGGSPYLTKPLKELSHFLRLHHRARDR